jgi:hypothetical protein
MTLSRRSLIPRRGDWVSHFRVSPERAPVDPSIARFTVTVTALDPGLWGYDYGHVFANGGCGLSASSDDGTNRVAIGVSATALVISWRFPLAETQRLPPGTYQVSIGAIVADEVQEIGSFVVVADSSPVTRPSAWPAVAAPVAPNVIPVVEEF